MRHSLTLGELHGKASLSARKVASRLLLRICPCLLRSPSNLEADLTPVINGRNEKVRPRADLGLWTLDFGLSFLFRIILESLPDPFLRDVVRIEDVGSRQHLAVMGERIFTLARQIKSAGGVQVSHRN